MTDFAVDLAGPDPDHLLDRFDEDLAVADAAGARRLDDGVDHGVHVVVGHHHVDFQLGQKIHHVLGAAIQLGVPLLTAKPLDLGHRQAGDSHAGQGFTDLIEFERLDDCRDLFHAYLRRVIGKAQSRAQRGFAGTNRSKARTSLTESTSRYKEVRHPDLPSVRPGHLFCPVRLSPAPSRARERPSSPAAASHGQRPAP